MRTRIEMDGHELLEKIVDADQRRLRPWLDHPWSTQMQVSRCGRFVYADTWEGFPPQPVRLLYLPERGDGHELS